MPTLNPGTVLGVDGNLQSFESCIYDPRSKYWGNPFLGTRRFLCQYTTTDITFGENAIENNYRLGTFTGLRLYPYPTEVVVRPYVGYAFSPYRYKQVNASGEEFKHTAVKSMYNAGLAYQLPSAYITLEYGRTANLILTPTFQELKQDLMPIEHVPLGSTAIETTSPSASPMNKKPTKSLLHQTPMDCL